MTGSVRSARRDYGPGPDQYGRLTTPPTPPGPHPVVVLVHGGFWRDQYRLALMEPLAADLVAADCAVWNIEYRRVGPSGGGWPTTLEDVAAAVDHLAEMADGDALDLDRVAVVGHSAGGHLAFWIGQRGALGSEGVGGSPAVVPRVVVGLAPVADLVAAAQRGLGAGAVVDFLGGSPEACRDVYERASPAELLPVVVEQVIVHGHDDVNVPAEMSEAYAERVGEPDRLSTHFFEQTDHFDVIDPRHRSWATVMALLADRLGP